LNFLCSRRCTAQTHPVCPRSYLQGRRAWPQPLCATLARTRCSSVTLSACCDAIRVGLPPPPVERPARTCGCANRIPPELPPSLRRATLAPSASARAMVCSHLATSKSSTSSSQCRLISSVAFSSTASDVHHARLYCSCADSPVVATLQLLPHRARPSCTPTRSRPELAQRGHRHAVHVAALHVVALHVVALHSSSSFSCCRSRQRRAASARACQSAPSSRRR
jgi:hypothetical protein